MEHGEMDGLEQGIYQLISQSFIRLDTVDSILMRRFGLTLTQSWALVHLGDAEGRSLSELAQLLICDKSNVTSIVDKLEEEGLATRKRGKAGDRRYTRVILTERGQRLRSAVMVAREYMTRERLQALSEDDRQNIFTSLQALAALLSQQYQQDKETIIIERAFEQGQKFLQPDLANPAL